MMENRTIERYRKRTVLLHWVHSVSFVILILTGGVMFLPGLGPVGGGAIGIIHRIAVVIFVAVPVLHALYEPKTALGFVKDALAWTKDDLKWFLAAPGYYFGGPEEKMPAQDRVNAGQKLWELVILVTGAVFLATGTILWFFRWSVPIPVCQWTLFVHGIAFVIVLVMFLVHLYLAVLHPRFRESLRSMLDGRVSPSYAKRHYRRWYDRITGNRRG
jgi:formate dehydrogenase subunit gamma